jgi:hypothetical protein
LRTKRKEAKICKTMKFILTVFSALLVISCNKDTIKYSFSGIVTETAEKGPLAEATVQLYQTPFNNSLTSNNYELAGGTTTAVNGLLSVLH